MSWWFSQTDNLGTIVAAIMAAIIGSSILAWGLWGNLKQWRAEAASRRHQELERRIEKFHTPQTRAALMMIHNYQRIITVIDAEQPVGWDDVELALIPALYREYLFEPRLTAIRDCFNDLLDGLANLHFLMQQKLVREVDVDHIAKVLLTRIVTHDERIIRNLRLYLIWRNTDIGSLFRRYGCDITSKFEVEQDIKDGLYGPCIGSPWGELNPTRDGSRG